jgi:polysaccharide pyruvyl transferase WcaK-like protein
MEFYRWYKAISILKDADMLVMTGTGMLGDFGILSTSLHYEIVKWSLAAKLCRCELLFVSVGAGPLRSRSSRILVKFALRLADYRSYRDAFSKEYLEGINFDTRRDFVFPDLAFSLPRTLIPSRPDRDGRGTVVGVGIMTYHNRRDSSESDDSVYSGYLENLGEFLAWLIERGYVVRLLIGDAVYDQPVRRDLRRLLEGKGIDYGVSRIIDEPASSMEEVLAQLAATDIVVASRFHNVLLALYLDKPVVAISYHEKVEALMAGFGLSEYCQDIENMNVERLVGQFQAAEKCAQVLKPRIEEKTEVCRTALEEQYARIFASTPS